MEAVGTQQSKYYPGTVVDATAGTHYYVMYSNNEWRRTLVAVARSLHRV